MTQLADLDDEQFLSLETFRKDGTGVKTPIWFVRDGDALLMWTVADSGKVKRIRNNPTVRFAPCKRFGEVTGDWMAAEASVDGSEEAVRHVETLLRRRLDLGFRVFQLVDRVRDRRKGSQRTCLKLSLGGDAGLGAGQPGSRFSQ